MEGTSTFQSNNSAAMTTFRQRRIELLSSLEKNNITVQEYSLSMKELEKDESNFNNSVRCLISNIVNY